MKNSNATEKKAFSLNHLIAPFILVTGVILSITSFVLASKFERSRIEDDFSALASDRTVLFEKAIIDDLNVLQSVAGFYYSSTLVERDEFRVFIRIISFHGSTIFWR